MKPPKVFISYAHAGKKLADDVLNFSNYLRSRGIDAEIDQYEEAPPQGLNRTGFVGDFFI